MQTALALGAYGGLVLAIFAALGRVPQKIARALYNLRISKEVRQAGREEDAMAKRARQILKGEEWK